MIDYYPHAKRAAKAYAIALRACTHDERRWNIGIHWEADRIDACRDCVKAAAELNRVYLAEMKRARKAELDALPRCEVPGCKYRGTARWGSGNNRALLCGRHGKRAEREFNRNHAGAIWLPVPALLAAQIVAMAQTER